MAASLNGSGENASSGALLDGHPSIEHATSVVRHRLTMTWQMTKRLHVRRCIRNTHARTGHKTPTGAFISIAGGRRLRPVKNRKESFAKGVDQKIPPPPYFSLGKRRRKGNAQNKPNKT